MVTSALRLDARRRDRLAIQAIGIAVLSLLLSSLATIWTVPLFDPDEGYYPATAAESVDAGSAWDPRFNGEPRWDKPILTYALIEASFGVFGRSVGTARMPSVIVGVLFVALAGLFVHRLAGPRAGGVAALVLATTLGVQVVARVAHPELGVVVMITAAELIAVAWLTTNDTGERLRLAVAGGVALGLGVLFKGPVALALPALAVTTACVAVYGLRTPSGTAIRDVAVAAAVAGLVAVPWYAGMTWRHGAAFLQEALWRHNVGRYTGASFVHRTPPWFLVMPTLVAMFPWTFLVPAGLSTMSRGLAPRNVLQAVMAAAAATSFLFYSASASKLPHYALAVVPPLAILVGVTARPWNARLASLGFRLTRAGLAALTLALAAVPWLVNHAIGAREIINNLPPSSHDVHWLFALPCWSAAAVTGFAALALSTTSRRRALPVLAVTGAALPLVLLLFSQPLLAHGYPWSRIGPRLRSSGLPVWEIGARAPSLTFHAGRPIARVSEADARGTSLPAVDAWIVVEQDWVDLHSPTFVRDPRWEPVESIGGVLLARWHGSRPGPGTAIGP
jgi:4-amino-4-deoxy-L-arabinose transferase-like glycosyltransferase